MSVPRIMHGNIWSDVVANADKLNATKGGSIKEPLDEIVVDDTAKWLVVVPLTKQASQKLGASTTWWASVRSVDNLYDEYTSGDLTTLIYIISKTTDEKYAIRFQNKTGKVIECRNRSNAKFSKKFQQVTGFAIKQLITQCMTNKKWQEFTELTAQSKIEKILQGGSQAAYEYARDALRGRWHEGEAIIAGDPEWAYKYAKDVIKGRWPEGEKAIASNPEYACEYARDVIKGRWPEGEAAIASNPEYACEYARDVIKGRWPEGEEAIAGDSEWACAYAEEVIFERWPEGEAEIASDPRWAYNYAKDVIHGRWPEGEPLIASDPYWAVYYAKDVIKGRFPEAEKSMDINSYYAYQYKEFLLSLGSISR